MPKDYVFFALSEWNENFIEEEEMVVKPYTKLLKRISIKWYYQNLIKHLPMKLGKLIFLEEHIPCVMLPFTKEEKAKLNEEYIERYIEKVMQRLETKRAYCIGELQERNKEKIERERTLLKYLYLSQIIKENKKRLVIQDKDVKLVIIDSGDKRVEHVLERFSENLNSLTIITDREEYFASFREMIYDTTGLVVEVEGLQVRNHIEGNIIIDLCSESYKLYNFFPHGACVIDVNSSSKKRQYLQGRRKDLRIIYDVELLYQGNIIMRDLMVNYLRAKSLHVEVLYADYDRLVNLEDIYQFLQASKIAFKELII
ncbi:hypothetical protein [Anaerosporobacter faecicola]|uniref:hypothetical protein n=1 Tax=Anaerosporobacter faecicola TaxID=2718714 RepID=UPI00143C02A9|nr:hypothetical protein [Anaerosporobacter faecicola]